MYVNPMTIVKSQDTVLSFKTALEMARSKKLKGLMACIDFKQAFDSVRHKFIYKSLKKMGVGNNLISLISSMRKT